LKDETGLGYSVLETWHSFFNEEETDKEEEEEEEEEEKSFNDV
jgi:hypothetical protein